MGSLPIPLEAFLGLAQQVQALIGVMQAIAPLLPQLTQLTIPAQ